MPDPGAVQEPEREKRAAWRQLSEAGLISAAAVLLVDLGSRVFPELLLNGSIFWALPACLALGVLSADFASGVLHWFCDNFFGADTPIVGRMLIQPFREHHLDPQGIVRHGLLELHANSCIPVILVLVMARAFLDDPVHGAWLLVHGWLFFFALSAAMTNQLHRWAHASAVSSPVRWLQRTGLILSPACHARHHRGDFSRGYCMTTGWMNAVLDRIEFFPRVERSIRALGSRAA